MVDMDLEKFFDTVCQSKLIEVLSRTIKDGRVNRSSTNISMLELSVEECLRRQR